MSVLKHQIRAGRYCDSIVLLKLQKGLAALPGITDAGAVMATAANLTLLAASGMLPEGLGETASDDLLLVVSASSDEKAEAALAKVENLLTSRRAETGDDEYRPKTLSSAAQLAPEAGWVLVSTPGRFAARVARQALELGRNVFLYSDNVSLADEVALKREATARGLLVMGPDCGTAWVGGIGLGFANRVPRGGVGLVGASGTGLQAVTCRLAALGVGVSHALGTGGRDFSAEVGGITTLQALDLLARDPETHSIVLLGKPPAPSVVPRLLAAARATGKPVVVCFLGWAPPLRAVGKLRFALNLSEAAEMAATVSDGPFQPPEDPSAPFLRGLFAGGTLAYEAVLGLGPFLGELHSNLKTPWSRPLEDLGKSAGHTLLDLGEDEFTVGRLHPMMDQDLRLRRFRQEAVDPEVGLILLDIELGQVAHADPAAEWSLAIRAAKAERELEVVVLLVGTADDPQGFAAQRAALEEAGARVETDLAALVAELASGFAAPPPKPATPVPLSALASSLSAWNVGLESFAESLGDQGAAALQVDWRPPAGGNEGLLSILDRLKGKST